MRKPCLYSCESQSGARTTKLERHETSALKYAGGTYIRYVLREALQFIGAQLLRDRAVGYQWKPTARNHNNQLAGQGGTKTNQN